MELLAVIAILGVLVALLLPAVAAQRETARRTQCASRLRQIGIGLQAHHGVYSAFPSGHVAEMEHLYDGKSWGWAALLLPFVEEQALSDRLDPTRRSFDEVAWDPDRAEYLRTNVALYRCPSDTEGALSHRFRQIFVPFGVLDRVSWSGGPTGGYAEHEIVLAHAFSPPPNGPPGEWGDDYSVGVRIAKSNYVACNGNRWKFQSDFWSNADFEGNGLFGRNSEVRQSEVSDGLSHTLAVGERSDRNYAGAWAGGNSWLGCGFRDNQMVLGTAFYPINEPPISLNIDCDGQGSANFSSNHHAGANFVYADGSVRFLSQEIDDDAFRALARRNDAGGDTGVEEIIGVL